MASSPRILNRPTHKYRADTEPTQKAPSQFIVPSRAQTSRRCETQAPRRPLVFLIVDLTGTRTRVLVDHVEQLDIICFGFRAAYRVLIYSWLDLDEVLRYSTRQHYPLGRKR